MVVLWLLWLLPYHLIADAATSTEYNFDYINPYIEDSKQLDNKARHNPAYNPEQQIKSLSEYNETGVDVDQNNLSASGQEIKRSIKKNATDAASKAAQNNELANINRRLAILARQNTAHSQAEQQQLIIRKRQIAQEQALTSPIISANNIHKMDFTPSKLMSDKKITGVAKDYVHKQPPMVTLNTLAGSDCKINGSENVAEIALEEYEAEVDSYRVTTEEQSCELDNPKIYYCDKELKMSCLESCPGNVISNPSYPKQIMFDYQPPLITIRHYQKVWLDPYRECRGHCLRFDGNINFYIADVSKITEFLISRISSESAIAITVNGNLVYSNYPDRVVKHISRYEDDSNKGYDYCAGYRCLNIKTPEHNDISPNIDLIPFLQNEINIISLKIDYKREDYNRYIQLSVKQKCCNKWSEEWIDTCPQ
ncbi:MAG: hypothetical protein AAF153_00060 [Pseudomonadota bacterium]